MRKQRSDKGSQKISMPFCKIYNLYYVQKRPSESLADEFGCDKSAVLRRMKLMGLPIRHHNDTKRGARARNRINLPEAEVVSMYLKKYESCASVGREFGVSSSVISRILSENGIDKKPLGLTKDVSREKHPGWSVAKTEKEREAGRFDPGLRDWRDSVYKRDKYTCVKCLDCSGSNLNAHHINPYWSHKHLRKSLSNGATLCDSCHIEFHKTYGFKHFTELDFWEWMK